MKLTTKGRYAVTAVMDLALHYDDGPIALASISERQHISLSYLEQLFGRLRKNGLVTSVRGPGGGYRLASAPDDITVSSVIVAVNEKVETTSCGGSANCNDNTQCLTHDLWEALSQQINDFLDHVTLGKLVAQHLQKCQNKTPETLRVSLSEVSNRTKQSATRF